MVAGGLLWAVQYNITFSPSFTKLLLATAFTTGPSEKKANFNVPV
jgi:hypothetical protein